MLTSQLSELKKGDLVDIYHGEDEFSVNGVGRMIRHLDPDRVLVGITTLDLPHKSMVTLRAGDTIGVSAANINLRPV